MCSSDLEPDPFGLDDDAAAFRGQRLIIRKRMHVMARVGRAERGCWIAVGRSHLIPRLQNSPARNLRMSEPEVADPLDIQQKIFALPRADNSHKRLEFGLFDRAIR